jgi:protein TonB
MSTEFLQSLLILFLIGIATTISHGTNLEEIASQSTQIDTTVYMVVQVPPKFPGGNEAMFQFIQSASQYSVSSKKGLLVQLKLLIEKDGSISSVQVAYADVADELIQEARRIAKMMPKWIPGSQDGRLLRVYALVPIRFIDVKKL